MGGDPLNLDNTMLETPEEFAHFVEFRNGAFYILPSAFAGAINQNRVGLLNDLGNEVDTEGAREQDLVFAVFKSGTIGLHTADAYRITREGRVFDGYCPIAVNLSDVGSTDKEELETTLHAISAVSDEASGHSLGVDWEDAASHVKPGMTGHFEISHVDDEGITLELVVTGKS